jgi:sterol-4alpha-carboxylate 3-dehydrogenase (decarboxylating)
MQSKSENLSILIIGGCGFVGSHLVRHFVRDPTCGSVAVVSRSATSGRNHVTGATYHSGNLTDPDSMKEVLSRLNPDAIIHAASPSPVTGTPNEYEHVTIQGTKILLSLAKKSKSVRALIYVSSSTLARGPEHVNLTEDYPLANTDPKSPAYARTKAFAEIMVLNANTSFPSSETSIKEASSEGYLLTSALRFPIIYGTHDLVSIPGCLSALQKGQTNVQLGDGKNLWSFCSTENACVAHSLLLQALFNPSTLHGAGKVGGEAFNIHDGSSHLFWDFARCVWKFAGHKAGKGRLIILPSWFAIGLASFLELLYWVFTLGTKRPYNMGKQQVEYACFTHTYSIEKSINILGFQPKDDFECNLKKAVEWSLQEDQWGEKLKKLNA